MSRPPGSLHSPEPPGDWGQSPYQKNKRLSSASFGKAEFRRKKRLEELFQVLHFQAMNYHVTLVQSEEGFAVWCDDLPGCNSQGATREEALENIRIAIGEYLAAQPEIAKRFGTRVTREEVTV